jgi:hypothetical protein
MKFKGLRAFVFSRAFVPTFIAGICFLLTAQGSAQTFYISPNGNDSNSGTSPNAPWASLNKVNSTDYNPGAQILFQAGGNWYGQLHTTSSGTFNSPIVYGSYGSGPNPTFWGSDPINPSGFVQEQITTTVYSYAISTPVNDVFIDHQFVHSSIQVTGSNDPQTNINYTQSTPNTWYDFNNTLYLNTGSTTPPASNDGHVYAVASRDSVVDSNGFDDITFQNLTVRETAAASAGYGFDIEQGANLKVLNSTAIATGKHAFGAINDTNFIGQGLHASYSMPDQGYGGASAFVSYTDLNYSGTSYQWINDTYTNSNGPYQGFITHEDLPGGISSVLVKNMITNGAPAMTLYSAAGDNAEQIQIIGGHMINGDIQVNANNVLIDGVLLTGGASAIGLYGNNNIVQNTTISGAIPDSSGGRFGAIILGGQNNIVRFNTVDISDAAYSNAVYSAADIGLLKVDPNASDGAQQYGLVYGNVLKTARNSIFQNFAGTPNIQVTGNAFTGASNPVTFYVNLISPEIPVTEWLQEISGTSLVGNADFANATAGEFWLVPGADGIDAIPLDSPLGLSLLQEMVNGTLSDGTSLGSTQVPEPATLGLMGLSTLLLTRRPRRNCRAR